MPHFYWKTIIFSVVSTLLLVMRLNLLRVGKLLPDFVLEFFVGFSIAVIIINEKLGERWGVIHYGILLSGSVILTIIIVLIHWWLKIW